MVAGKAAHFRDQQIAASLKLGRNIDYALRYWLFPRSADRGLIEASRLRRFPKSETMAFPRSADRGLIEAMGTAGDSIVIQVFPRSADRGLIEANLETSSSALKVPHFRDQQIAASLKRGKQPYWPYSLFREYLQPALKQAGITRQVGWHTLRHTFGTLMKANGEDIKTIQEVLRHSNYRVTADIYTQAVTPKKREAQSRVVRMILPGKRLHRYRTFTNPRAK